MALQLLQMDYLACDENSQAIAILHLNDVQHKNTFTEDLVNELLFFLEPLAMNENLRAFIITGAQKFFSAGGNLQEMLHSDRGLFAGSASEITQRYQVGIQRVMQIIYDLPMPTIAAINGPAVGAGLGLALTCDLRVAVPEAIFAEGFTRIGLIAGDGDAWLLPRVVGMAHASYLAFTNTVIDADKALQMGLINEVISAEKLLMHSVSIATKIAQAPRRAMIEMKKLLRQSMLQTFSEALDSAAAIQGQLHCSSEHKEAVRNLLAKIASKG